MLFRQRHRRFGRKKPSAPCRTYGFLITSPDALPLSHRGLVGDSRPLNYNTRHKSLKQEPFVLNFLQISYIHSSHLCSHSNVPLSFPNVEPSVFWSIEMTANPNQHWGGKNHTRVSRFVTRIIGSCDKHPAYF